MIGRRLRSARSASGLSLRALAEAANGIVTAQAIGKYERDEDMPRSSVLIALSDALDVPVDYLMGQDELELEGVEFRKAASASAKEEARIRARTLAQVQRYLVIESLLNLSSQDWDAPRTAPYPVFEARDAEAAARSVRADWQLGSDPIPMLAELLEEHGIKVISFESEHIDGLAAKVLRNGNDQARVIVIRKQIWGERKRFNLAHELAHMVLRVERDVDREAAANRFAGAFLVPAEVLRQEIGTHRKDISIAELLALKTRFGVSVQALTYRCKDLDIINQATYVRLFKAFKEHGWRDPPFKEPNAIPALDEEPRRFERLCFRALSEGLIGPARAAELLGTNVRELEQKLDSAVG